MKTTTTQFLKACSLSVALLGSAAMTLAISLPDVAYANNGKGNGNGGGNGNGAGNSGGNGKSGGNGGNENGGGNTGGNGNSVGKYPESSKASDKSTVVKKKAKKAAAPASTEIGGAKAGKIKPKHTDSGLEDVAHPSELGALNAAHANAKALENASPNSRVGRIAAYRDAVLAGQELATDLEEKSALLATLDKPARDLADIEAELATADADALAKATTVAELEADLAAAGGMDPAIEAALQDARDELNEAKAVADDLKAEQDAAIQYATLTAEVEDLTQKVEDQPMVERSTLEAAANKPVTDEVEAAVKVLLGL